MPNCKPQVRDLLLEPNSKFENYPQIKTQKQIKIGPYGCTMDEGVKTLRKPESAPIRWLQCSKGEDFFRLMSNCKDEIEDNSFLIIGKKSSKIELLSNFLA